MNPHAVDDEITAIAEYNSFVQSWERTAHNEVRIITLEGKLLRVSVSAEGWEILNSSTNDEDILYPTIEALLMRNSNGFKTSWNNELFSRLQSVA